MLLGFETENKVKANAAFIIYVIYRSRDKKRGPSGVDMWGQIERFAKASAKRAEDIDDFVEAYKKNDEKAFITENTDPDKKPSFSQRTNPKQKDPKEPEEPKDRPVIW